MLALQSKISRLRRQLWLWIDWQVDTLSAPWNKCLKLSSDEVLVGLCSLRTNLRLESRLHTSNCRALRDKLRLYMRSSRGLRASYDRTRKVVTSCELSYDSTWAVLVHCKLSYESTLVNCVLRTTYDSHGKVVVRCRLRYDYCNPGNLYIGLKIDR